MDIPVLTSTAFLTVLLAIGLVFFIRASSKDRTQVVKLITNQPEQTLKEQLNAYFSQRAYRVDSIDPEQNRVTFSGLVRPSLFLAVFVSLLAGVGILCLALVLAMLYPAAAPVFPALVLLAPGAGVFYWKTAGRPETVVLSVETLADTDALSQNVLTVTAHRDELLELQTALQLTPCDTDD